jgi:rRNA-processing protein FCF1
MIDPAKHRWLDPPGAPPGTYSPKDQHVVAAAAAQDDGCLLATMDERLAEALNRDGIPVQRGFLLASVRQAQEALRPG